MAAEEDTTRFALIGLGTVGVGVARLLLLHRERLERRVGRRLELAKVVVRDLAKPRDVQLPKDLLTSDLNEVLKDDSIQVVGQLIGGVEEAERVMKLLLDSGKDVVTANKALLAARGAEMFRYARDRGRSIAFEASVAGGIPIVAALGQSLAGNEFQSIRGILNGTCNYIISEMEAGADYADAVREAQRLGYAEADPTMDVDGADAAQKLAILAQLAFGADVPWEEIPRVGIDRLQTIDMQYAAELGYRIRLLACAERHEDALDLFVCPTLVRQGRPLAEVREAFNAISIRGDYVGRVFFQGQGAGREPTASAVMGDLLDSAVGRAQMTFRSLDLWNDQPADVRFREPHLSKSRFYLRFAIEDHPGVLAEIAGVLGEHGISIASVVQHETSEEAGDEAVPLVIVTHYAQAGALDKALERIDASESVKAHSVRMRIMD